MKDVGHARAHGADGRIESEQDTGEERRDHGESEGRPVYSDLVDARYIGRQESPQDGHSGKGQEKPESAAQKDERQTLRQGPTQQPAAAGTQRGPDREFALVRRRPSEHEIGHVHATDQEHERRRPRQNSYERAEAAHELLQRRRDVDAPAPIALRVLPLDAHRDRRHFGTRLFHGNVVLQPTHHVVDAHCTRIHERRVDGQRLPDSHILGPGRELEIGGHHTHHRIGGLTQVEDRADHIPVGFEALGP